MDSISGINSQSAAPAFSFASGISPGQSAPAAETGTSTSEPAAAGSQLILGSFQHSYFRIQSEVSQMLIAIGGGAEQNSELSRLLALMIFMALLNGDSESGQNQRPGLRGVDDQPLGQLQFLQYSSSKVSVEYEESSLTFLSLQGQDAYGGDGGSSPALGGQFDASA